MAAIAQFPDPPKLGPASQHCSTCGAVLAADQRYCLNCGTRRAESRVAFPESLAGGREAAGATPTAANAPAPGATVVPAASAPKAKRSWADRDLLLPVLGTALLAIAVGILIGRSGASDTINTKAPVVNVAPTAGAATAAGTAADAAATDSGTTAATKSTTASDTKSSTSSDKAAPPANVSKSTLQDNANATGKDYVNKSKKLPTEVSTGGKPLPKDNKPAGGGSDGGTTIG